jgi:hypothetical protein
VVEMKKMKIFGCEPYTSIPEKNRLIKVLKKEYQEKLSFWWENGFLFYKSYEIRENY